MEHLTTFAFSPEKIGPAPGESARLIGFLVYDGVNLLDLTGPMDALVSARIQDANSPAYKTVLVGLTNRTITTSSGVSLKTPHTIASAPVFDTIFIPGGAGLRNSATRRMIADWLGQLANSVRRVAAVSTGVYPLADSGLLDGRRVTTHWRHARNLAAAFPRLKVDDSGSFIKDERFYTCGGGTAGIEMTLAMIQEDCGSKTALHVAREMVVSLKPSSDCARRISPMLEEPGTEERLAELPAWITSRLRSKLSLKVLAARACLCPRHFSRLFKRTFQSTPADFVEHLRITEAARRLASQPLSITAIGESVGYKSPLAFRRAFRRRFGITPRTFQTNLKTSRQEASAAAVTAPFRNTGSASRKGGRHHRRKNFPGGSVATRIIPLSAPGIFDMQGNDRRRGRS